MAPEPNARQPLLFFNETDAGTIEAATARIFPTDELGPGAREAGVIVYLDRALAGPYAQLGDTYRIIANGLEAASQFFNKQRFAELVADTGPQNYTDDGFGVHLAFFNRTPAEARMRILEGRRRQVEERREGLREAVARASSSLDRYTRQLHQLGLESSEREVKWLNDLIAAERVAQGRAEQSPS